jgi:hypothetical protein
VAHIGVGARAFSYATNGRDMPEGAIRVELTGPRGDTWTWGPSDAVDVVAGPALDFCLVVTQRRHIDDTDLVVTGALATDWISIAQASPVLRCGRKPGQFAWREIEVAIALKIGGGDAVRIPSDAKRALMRERKASIPASSVAFIVDSNWLAWASRASSFNSTKPVTSST